MFSMDLNGLTEVGLLTTALGHLKQIFFQAGIQRSEICFKPGNKHGTKCHGKQLASWAQVEAVPTAEAISSHFYKPGQPWAPGGCGAQRRGRSGVTHVQQF